MKLIRMRWAINTDFKVYRIEIRKIEKTVNTTANINNPEGVS